MSVDFFVTASIVTYNDADRAPTTVKSIAEHTKKYPLKLYVIDNASVDDTVDKICEFLDNDCTLLPEYASRIDKIFPYRDNQNCKRTFEIIKEICENAE